MKKKLLSLQQLKSRTSSVSYARRNDLHLARKLFHISGGFLTLYPFVVLRFSPLVMASGLACALALIMGIEMLRVKSPTINEFALLLFKPILRQSEVEAMSGVPFYISSCLLAFLIFPHHIAVLSILYLALGDPSSSFFGVLLGRSKLFPNKSLEGTLGGFGVCAVVTLVYLNFYEIAVDRLVLLSILGGFIGCLSELLPLNIDDNFAIPIVSGLLLTWIFWCANLPLV